MLKNLKLRSKVLIILLFIAIMTAGVVGLIAFTLGKNTLKEESFNKLTAIRELKAHQIENYFKLIFDQVRSLSESRTVIEATLQFKKGFYELNDQIYYSDQELLSRDSSLLDYYQAEFIDKLFYRDSAINYFSIPSQELKRGRELWLNTVKADNYGVQDWKEFPHISPSGFEGNLSLSGSSTVSSLANHIIDLFKENGAQGEISYITNGTDEGLQDLVNKDKSVLTGASHSLSESEKKLFEDSGLTPLAFRIGTDALVVVVGKSNQFLSDISWEELEKVFSTAVKWSDINPDWPDKEITRFIPSEGSGSYKVFSNLVLNGNQNILINLPNTQIISDGSGMNEVFEKDPNTIAFFSYNYFNDDSPLKLLSIDGVSLNNNTIRRDQYKLTRPLFLVTTKQILSENTDVATLINYFLNAIDDEIGINLGKSEYWPQHVNHRILQYQYILNNPYPKGEKDNLISSGLNTGYDKAHEIYHPILKNYLDRFGYYDIFLVDADSGHIIYSTSKEVDFATDILQGPYSNTGISRVFRKVIENDDPTAVCFEDFNPYPPSYNAPASFIASSIINNEKVIGVLIFQLPIDKINHIMTDGYKWSEVGLGKTGETYLVGDDFLMRTQSRFLVEDPKEYFLTIERTDISRETIAKIRSLKSSIGLQPIRTIGTEQAIKGNSGTQIFKDYREVEVLSAYRPLNIEGFKWVIMSEKDKSEAFAAIDEMTITFAYWSIVLLVFILVLSFFFARSISKPLQMLTQRASGLAKGNLDDSVKLKQTDEIGVLAENFEFMRCSVKKLVDNLNDVNEGLERQVNKRTQELNRAKEAADAILDKSPVPVAVVDISTATFIRVNEAMCEFNELSEQELLNRATLDIYFDPEHDRPIILDQIREFGKIEDLEVRSKRIGTGEERWSIINVHPITYLDKDVYITTVIDITERKRMEEEINKQKLLMENTLESLTHPFYVIDTNDYSLLITNSAARRLSKNEANTCYALTHKRGTPCDSKDDPCPLKIIKETKKPVILEHIHYDAEGNPRYAEVHGYPIFDKEGNVIQMIEYSMDITERKLAEEELHAANQRFQAIVDNLADGLIIINVKGLIEFYSPSAEKLFQYTQDEVRGKNITLLMGSPHRENHANYLKNYLDTGVAKIIGNEREVEAIRKDGSVFPARLMISEIRTDNNHLFVGLIGDLSDRKEAERQLKTQAAAMESAANGIVITNQLGIIQWVNPAFHELTGYHPEEVIGNNPSILKSGRHDDSFYANMWETISKGDVWHDEVINKKKNGDLYYEEMTLTPVYDDKGNITQFVAIKQDITERKKAEEELIASENKFRSIASTASDAIISTDKNGLIESWNNAAQFIFGYSENEALKQPLEIIIPEKYHDKHQNGMKRVLQQGDKNVIGSLVELEGKRKNGQIFPIEMSLSDWKGKEGIHFSAIIRDITERKIIEKALNKANKRMKGELNVAKDIQMSMLPLIFPAFPKRNEIDLYAELIPAREVGGDFYDFYFLDENHFCFVVGDVSGKGVPAALMMAVTKTLIKSQAVNDRSTASILTHVNNEIARDNDTYMFITVFMAILDTNTGELVYSNAGHNPSYILNDKNKGHIKLGDLHGPVVGAMEEMTYKETKLKINKDDLIVVYTDGVTESHNMNEELYSDEKFIQLLESESKSSPKDLINKIINSVKSFEGEAEQFDDITLLAIRYLQEPNTISSDRTSIKIKNDLKEITTVIDHFEFFGEKNNIAFPIIQKFNIAFDELLNNNISYGFKDNSEHIIDVEIELKGSRLIITITDDGMPFNPFVKNPPDTKLSVSERDIGGLGIHIVKNLMDEYDYKRSADKNIITLIKHNINT